MPQRETVARVACFRSVTWRGQVQVEEMQVMHVMQEMHEMQVIKEMRENQEL